MTMGETINFYGSVVCLAGCLLFLGVFSVMPFVTGRVPWWSSQIGRMMVTKAIALAGLMLITVVTYLADPDLEWVRSVRGVFALVIGTMMMYQTRLVIKIQRGREES